MDYQDTYLEQNDFKTDYEIERGKPMPSKNHGKIQTRLSASLINKYFDQYDVETEVALELTSGKGTPDIMISTPTLDDWMTDEIRVSTPPITTIEILSPKQSIDELKDKIISIYFPGGVKSAWLIVPPFQTVYVMTPDKKVLTFTSGIIRDPVTGIEIDMKEIFNKRV